MPTFKAAITRGAVPVIRDIIEITDRFFIYRKRKIYLIGFTKVVIPLSKISSIELNSHIIGTDITITSFGTGTITAHRFTLSDANEIKSIIEKRI
jgi:hypothetical protein